MTSPGQILRTLSSRLFPNLPHASGSKATTRVGPAVGAGRPVKSLAEAMYPTLDSANAPAHTPAPEWVREAGLSALEYAQRQLLARQQQQQDQRQWDWQQEDRDDD